MPDLNIMELRKRAGLTQQELAKQLGLTSDQTVSDWEKNKRIPRLTPKQTRTILAILDCSLDDLCNAFPDPFEPQECK